jgi:hypothetical protein
MKKGIKAPSERSPRISAQRLIAQLARDKEKVKKAKAGYKAALDKLLKVCPHDHVARCEWESSASGMSTYSPMRICMDCGLEEDEWSVEGSSLNGKLYHKQAVEVTRDEIYRYRKIA